MRLARSPASPACRALSAAAHPAPWLPSIVRLKWCVRPADKQAEGLFSPPQSGVEDGQPALSPSWPFIFFLTTAGAVALGVVQPAPPVRVPR